MKNEKKEQAMRRIKLMSGITEEQRKALLANTLKQYGENKWSTVLTIRLGQLLVPGRVAQTMVDENQSNKLFSVREILAWTAIDLLRYLAIGAVSFATIARLDIPSINLLSVGTAIIFGLTPVLGHQKITREIFRKVV